MTVTTISPTILQKVWGTDIDTTGMLCKSKLINGETVPRGSTTVRIPIYLLDHTQRVQADQIANPTGSEARIPRGHINFKTVDFPLDRWAYSEGLDIDLQTLVKNPNYFPPNIVEAQLQAMRWQCALQEEAALQGRVTTLGNWTVNGINFSGSGAAGQWDVQTTPPASDYSPFTDPASGILTNMRLCRTYKRKPNIVWIPWLLWQVLIDNSRAIAELFPGGYSVAPPDITTDLVAKHLSTKIGYPVQVEIIEAQYTNKPGTKGAIVDTAVDLWTDGYILGCVSQNTMGRNDLFYRTKGWEGAEDRQPADEITALRVYWTDETIFTPSYSYGFYCYDCAHGF